ncbi:YtxH domain-containing protein [Lentibacillus cibarius]|uniref:YtxH domain-containing protein n=1 Tax=Lentibacillus cibarius TaxID=2583219 RepID=A0A5S3QM16_9BACI|nr:YtxH domain-containing protein [Lentibacillus cibarius]TMN22829.1 YtxH domain-containing protein [Lentibacillus cibarius]
MGKRKLCLGIVVGSIVGGLLSLLDREARSYAKGKWSDVKSGSSYYVKRPSEAVQAVKDVCNQFNEQVTTGADNAMNALEQVEHTLSQFTGNEPEKLEK